MFSTCHSPFMGIYFHQRQLSARLFAHAQPRNQILLGVSLCTLHLLHFYVIIKMFLGYKTRTKFITSRVQSTYVDWWRNSYWANNMSVFQNRHVVFCLNPGPILIYLIEDRARFFRNSSSLQRTSFIWRTFCWCFFSEAQPRFTRSIKRGTVLKTF